MTDRIDTQERSNGHQPPEPVSEPKPPVAEQPGSDASPATPSPLQIAVGAAVIAGLIVLAARRLRRRR